MPTLDRYKLCILTIVLKTNFIQMKLFNHISFGILGALFTLSSCSYYEKFDNPTPAPDNKEEIEALLPKATSTFAKLKSKYMTPAFLLFDNQNHSSELKNKYALAFTGYQIPADSAEIINAVVVSSDLEGNTYKKMVLRDLTDGSALDISVDASGLSGPYPLGQRVSINFAGLHIGDYANSPVIGYQIYNDNTKRLRYEIGRLPYLLTRDRIKPVGMADTTLIAPEVMTIAQIKALGREGYGRLVRIKGVKFGYYVTAGAPDFFETPTIKWVNDTKETNIPFSHENSLNVPVSRALSDGTGTINLTTSSYAKFADKGIPMNPMDEAGNITSTFDIIAIVGWYRDQLAKDGSYQLSLQRYQDIIEYPIIKE